MHGPRWLDDLGWDVRHALRVLLHRDRAFALSVVTMLALALAVNVIAFTMMQAMTVRGYRLAVDSARLVAIQEVRPNGLRGISYADFEEWRAQAPAFEDIAAVMNGGRVAFTDSDGHPSDLPTWAVSANTFGLLGVRPLLGRDFLPADEVSGAPPVTILNYRFWVRHFGRRPDVVGSIVLVNGVVTTVVGVMPQGFEFPHQLDFWTPAVRTPQRLRRGADDGGYLAWGRLRRGVSADEARSELETINRRLQTAFPATNHDLQISVVDNAHFHAGPNGPVIYGSLWIGACFVLLIACANISNLAVVRTVGHWREFSTRMALGAGWWRLLRHVLVDSLILSSIAGACAWEIARFGLAAWATATASPYQIYDYRIDAGTAGYLIAICAAVGILCALGPMVRLLQLRAGGALTGAARGASSSPRSRRFAAALVAGQMMLAIVLLSGSGVLVRSLLRVVRSDSGVRDPDHVLVGSVRLPSEKFPTPALRQAYVDRLEARLGAIAGIAEVSEASALPAQGGRTQPFEIDTRHSVADENLTVQFVWVAPNYFRALGANVVAGRDFNRDDDPRSAKVVLVSQSFVDRFLLAGQGVGQRLRVTSRNQSNEWRTIVGIVPNLMFGDPVRQQFKPVVYVPYKQDPLSRLYFLARTSTSTAAVAPTIRSEVGRLDADVTLEEFRTLRASFAFDSDNVDVDHMALGKSAAAAPIFAVVALLLAAVGLYAVIAHSVTQRTHEIGIRLAIGAAAADIRRLVLHDGIKPVMAGSVSGLAASLAVNQVLRSQLVGVSPYDPLTLAVALVVLVGVALLACSLPVRRAIRVDPAVALRQE